MLKNLRACLILLAGTVVLCCVVYPTILWGIGKTPIFAKQAEGSLIERDGNVVGSRLIAQPFGVNDEKYFQPRPSAASYDASNSSASNWAGNNYLLRDRVAQQLGPIVRYAGGAKKPVGPDIDLWLKADKFRNQSGIVAQWANLHTAVAQKWIKSDPANSAYVADWQKSHPNEVAAWVKDNPATPEPKPEDLAAPFFADFSKSHPGSFLKKTADGKGLELTSTGDDIRKAFFDMWLTDHAGLAGDLEKVPADMVTASASGLDPHITLENALWQLDHFPIAAAWAKSSGKDEATVREDIRKLVNAKSSSPWGGLIGVPLVNVLELNVALDEQFKK
jgi:potassium-transporting ATPase KdpC subunit